MRKVVGSGMTSTLPGVGGSTLMTCPRSSWNWAGALIGKKVGDSVEVSTPAGEKAYEILKVRFK